VGVVPNVTHPHRVAVCAEVTEGGGHMLSELLSAWCYRKRVFISYAREDKAIAEEVAQAIVNAGHSVFIDIDHIDVGGDYNTRIRQEIAAADMMIFFLSKASLAAGAYTLNELAIARDRWPSSTDRVWPVMVGDPVAIEEVPAYLRAVHIHQGSGNLAAELMASLAKATTLKPLCIRCGIVASMAVVAGVWLLWPKSVVQPSLPFTVELQQVDFRPERRPDDEVHWQQARMMTTVGPLQIVNKGSRPLRVALDRVTVSVDGADFEFTKFNDVELKPDCADWLCYKSPARVVDIPAFGLTEPKEIMFEPSGRAILTWRDFWKTLCQNKQKALSITVTLASTATLQTDGSEVARRNLTCIVDTDKFVTEKCPFRRQPPPHRYSPPCRETGFN